MRRSDKLCWFSIGMLYWLLMPAPFSYKTSMSWFLEPTDTLQGKMDFAIAVMFRILRWGDYLGLSR